MRGNVCGCFLRFSYILNIDITKNKNDNKPKIKCIFLLLLKARKINMEICNVLKNVFIEAPVINFPAIFAPIATVRNIKKNFLFL